MIEVKHRTRQRRNKITLRQQLHAQRYRECLDLDLGHLLINSGKSFLKQQAVPRAWRQSPLGARQFGECDLPPTSPLTRQPRHDQQLIIEQMLCINT